jgi:hypothetical protein
MKIFFIKTLLAGYLLLFLASVVNSQQRKQLFPGARPFGMGETFVAIADDGNAIYWNPAGLPYLNREEFNFMYSNLYGINIKNLYFSYTRPLFKKLAFGIDWLRYGFDDKELVFGRNHWNLSLGYALNNQLAFGSNIKLLTTNTTLENISYGNAWGAGIDIGLLANHQFKGLKFLKELRAGLMLHNATNTWIRFDTGTQEKILPRNLRFGCAYKPFDTISWKWLALHDPIIALDIDDRIHVGSEVWFLKDKLPFALRGGVQKDLYTDEALTWSAGFSIQKDFFRIDYALTMPPILPATHRFSIALIYNFNPHLVEVTKAQVENVFSSLIRYYNKPKNYIGKVWLRNKHDEPIENAKVSFKVKDYTETICWQGRLDTGLVTPIDLVANFNDEVLKIDETEKSLSGDVEVAYSIRNKPYKEKAPVRFFLYGNRAIRWDEPGRAVAFITQEDSLVRAFSTTVRRNYEIDYANWFLKREMADAIKIYEALHVYGIGPTPDPNATYSSATTDGFYIDTITWPDVLLSNPRDQRKGDCEDLAILYSSLLESIGIQTALLKTTGHIFMMFNTGIPIAHRFSLPVKDSLFVKEKGYLWLPIETTYLRSTFVKAWQEGALNYWSALKIEDLEILFVRDEQINYPSLSHAPVKRKWWAFPDSASVHPYVSSDLKEIDSWKDQFIENNYFTILEKYPDSLSIRNQLGCFYVGLSKFEKAMDEFKTVLNYDSSSTPSLNNLGNIYFINGEIDSARQCYEKCLKTQKFKSGTYINLAILYQMMSETTELAYQAQNLQDKSYEMLERVVHLVGEDSTEVLSLLGIVNEDIQEYLTAEEKKEKSWFKERIEEVKIFINKSLAAMIQKRHPKGKRPKLKSAGPTGGEADENRRFILYWDFEGI